MMARFVPDVRPEDINHESERMVYEALRSLPDSYIILHSFPWLRPNRDLSGEPLREGEADFVILHPERGLLVVEVKGGSPKLDGRTWVRSGKQMRDPFDQARRSRYALLEAIEERTRRHVHRGLFAHGDMVVFPQTHFSGHLPLNSDPRILVDASGLGAIASHVDSAFEAWSRDVTQLSAIQFAELVDALMPKLRLLRCVGAELNADQRRIVQITLDQRATLLGLLENSRVLVEGTAGSGKTMLALEFALSLASQGERVLLLCYNRNLSVWLQEQASLDSRSQRTGAGLEISTFHAYAHALARRAQVDFLVPTQGLKEFWDNEVPLVLEQSLEVLKTNGQAQLFDSVIVDEAQDFAPDWWVAIESMSRGGNAGKLFVFLDLQQSLRGGAVLPPVVLPTRFRLTTNCRNTKAIAQSAALLAKLEIRILPGSPTGEAPAVRRAISPNTEAGLVLAEVRQLLSQGVKPNQIALIGPAAFENSKFARQRAVGEVPLIDEASSWRRGEGILVTTARSFKGLEADVVVAYGLSGFSQLFTPTDLYVAWTRARHRLILFTHSGEIRQAAEAAVSETRL